MASLTTPSRRPLYSELSRAFTSLQRGPWSDVRYAGFATADFARGPQSRASLRAPRCTAQVAPPTSRSRSAGVGALDRQGWESRWHLAGTARGPLKGLAGARGPARAGAFRSLSSSSASPPPEAPHTDPATRQSDEHAHATEAARRALAKRDPHPLAKPEQHPLVAASTPHPAYLSSLSRSIRRAASALPSVGGRPPPKEQLLSLTNSFFERLKIRFKWLTIRSYRRFRADDYSAFFSFGILGTLGWFLLKTTSAFAVLFFVANSLSLQEWLAGKLGAYLTDSTGVKVVFESAIVPKWGIFGREGSKIVFKNVYVSRGPVKGELGVLPAALEGEHPEETEEEAKLREMVAKWTHFHLSIDTVEVSLSLGRWLDGKGLIKEAAIRGVRGVIERSHIVYDPLAPKDRFAYRNKPRPGDFWLEGLQIEDFLVTIYQPENFRPYTFSVFHADIPRLRKQWLFYDLMSADAVTGQIDNCLFSLHRPQSIGRTSEEDLRGARWARMSRFRIDGVPIDHMQSTADTGVMSWITSGRCDLVADIRFPHEDDELDLSALVDHLVDEIGGRLGAEAAGAPGAKRSGGDAGRRLLSRDALQAPHTQENAEQAKLERKKALRYAKESEMAAAATEADDEHEGAQSVEVGEQEEDKIVSIDLDIRFKDLKATVPYFTSSLSYVNNALIRPIVAFINRNRTLIPIHCHIDLGLSEFNGSWTTYDVGILDRMSEQVYAALAHHVSQSNDQRLQTVGLWTLQMTANTVLGALKDKFTLAPY
ncbi:mitochondrial distribution and morphology protein [Rhodotorula paludigena]|uniref:mitochondrial distribution and morphology protein n=1 Tax=Rhodotorula paludigena TaxID=86838 RepID=UPI003177B47B